MKGDDMRVRFTAAFDFKPTPRYWKTFDEGMVRTVPRACGEAAVAAGKAVEVKTPRRKAAT